MRQQLWVGSVELPAAKGKTVSATCIIAPEIECDVEIERTVAGLNIDRPVPESPLPKAKHRSKMPSDPNFDVRSAIAGRIGNAKAVTVTARKIAILFYNAMRHGMDYRDPGA